MARCKSNAPSAAAEPSSESSIPGPIGVTEHTRHTTYERFRNVVVHRSQLKNAPYNPRIITANARRKLKASLKKLKRIGPENWNPRTGNIVGGHQRLDLLDALEGTSDYTLTVAAADPPLSDDEEMAANIALNHSGAQGEFDFAKLEEMVSSPGLDLEAAGLDVADVYRMFGDKAFDNRPIEAQDFADQSREAAKHYDSIRDDNGDRHDIDYYVVVVFGSNADRDAFLTDLDLPIDRFQDGRQLRELYGLPQVQRQRFTREKEHARMRETAPPKDNQPEQDEQA
jgi:hypothetical protein